MSIKIANDFIPSDLKVDAQTLESASPKILIVEDEYDIAEDIQNRLLILGYPDTSLALSGEEAIELGRNKPPELILMDVMLKGGIDGIETAQRFREIGDIPVIYLTAFSDADALRRARETEPFGYIVKPFQTRDLRIAIEMGLYKHRVDRRVRENSRWMNKVLANISDSVIAIRASGQIRLFNLAAEKLTGWTEFEALGQNLKDVVALSEESGSAKVPFPPKLETQGENFNAILTSRSGAEVPVEVGVQFIGDDSGGNTDYLFVIRDISGQKASEEYMKNLAFLDNLTGLPNRALVYDRIHLALTHSRSAGRFVSFLFLDLDGFKNVNDTLGHDAGDHLLQQTAERLKSVVRDEDTVGRMAGDEFVMILHNVAGEEETIRVAEKIIEQFQKPFSLNGMEIKKTVSVGISLFPRDGSDMESVMKCADQAMYLAKQKGKNAYEVYRPGS